MQLQATLRTIKGKQVNAYRKQDKIPGILYGKSLKESVAIFFDKNTFLKVYKESGKSQPVEIKWEWLDHLVLIHQIEVHPVYSTLSHVDFLVVKKGEAVHAEVELRFINESPAEKNKIGRVNTLLSTIEVFADPTKLPKYIEVDMWLLQDIHDVIFVKELVVPEGVKIETDSEQPVVTVVALADDTEESSSEPTDVASESTISE